MRIVFMGTPAIAASVLSSLAGAHEVIGVLTRPDAVSGRGKKRLPSAVKATALELGLPVFEASSFKDDAVFSHLESLAPDVICVVAYGAILPEKVLSLPKYGCLNVHASLLPRWRGAAPIERAILAGDELAGVCIMRMEKGLDTGAYCERREVSVAGKSQQQLTSELASVGSEALITALSHIEGGSVSWVEQDERNVTYAEKIQKGELDVSPDDSAVVFTRKVLASSEAHPSRCVIDGKRVLLLCAMVADDEASHDACGELNPGEAVFRFKRLLLKTVSGTVEVSKVKPEGKKEMDSKAFCAGIQNVKTKVMEWERA